MKQRKIKITEKEYKQGKRDRIRLHIIKKQLEPVNKILNQILQCNGFARPSFTKY